MNQNRTPLFDGIKKYHKSSVIPFDVPGHKHGKGLSEFADFLGGITMEIDVNSMKELDNLGNPQGIIKEAEELAAKAHHAGRAFFLVNGTTLGVQCMILSACRPGEKIIMPRNAHKSAINGLILSGAMPVYIQPEISHRLGIAMGVTYKNVLKGINENPDAKAIFLINPTYYGAVSDIISIIKLAKERNLTILVDEAHGTHFDFNKKLPISGMKAGADMSTVSYHKTGGALTQSSILLVDNDDVWQVKKFLNLSQTTSASYLLMTSLDVARKNLATKGEAILNNLLQIASEAREEINEIDAFYAFGKELIGTPGVFDFDETKLGINVSELGYTGFEVYDILREEFNIQMELADPLNVLAILSVGDTKDNVCKLVDALKVISKRKRSRKIEYDDTVLHNPDVIVSPRDAFYAQKKRVKLIEAENEISGESIMYYPPGIPIISPGERINKDTIEYIKYLKTKKCTMTDMEDQNLNYINVLGI